MGLFSVLQSSKLIQLGFNHARHFQKLMKPYKVKERYFLAVLNVRRCPAYIWFKHFVISRASISVYDLLNRFQTDWHCFGETVVQLNLIVKIFSTKILVRTDKSK